MVAFAQDRGYEVIDGCKRFVESRAPKTFTEVHKEGTCYGVCLPERYSMGQAVRIVVTYMEKHPDQMHEQFAYLALLALRDAWPCKKP